MTEQMGTPGSTADTSVNGGKTGAPKDKACPFCNQQFTSSSLGRHLDLYIKEKNPKPPDGIHDVDGIRKLRGGITRRQPRNSTSRREDSTPAGTPSAQDRRSPRPEEARENRSPSVRRDDGGPAERIAYNGERKQGYSINKPTWEATGVMNIIPPARNGDARSWDGDERDGRRAEARGRSVSKQMLAKTTFEQKQKMIEALDNAKAAELALRELFGSLRAAKLRIEGPPIFDYDPLTLDFPALCLHCLPPPPTLFQAIPLPTSTSWSISPPDDQQYQALRSHFSAAFQKWRVSCAIATTATSDDLSYPPPQSLFDGLDDPSEIARKAEASASEQEQRISEHLHAAFAHWNNLPQNKRQEIWMLEFARSVGRKSEEIQKLKKEREFNQQDTQHLRQQVDEMSRLQHPREFKLVSPTTLAVTSELMNEMGELGLKYKGIGFDLMDRHVHLDTAIERAIGRWRDVVKGARGGGSGLTGQRSLSGEHALPQLATATAAVANMSGPSTSQQNFTTNSSQAQNQNNVNHNHNQTHSRNPSTNSNSNPTTNGNTQPPQQQQIPPAIQTNGITHTDMGSDPDADADADMDDDDSFIEMTDAPHHQNQNHTQGANFRLANGNTGQTNGNGGGRGVMEGIESQVVSGYVRIGA